MFWPSFIWPQVHGVMDISRTVDRVDCVDMRILCDAAHASWMETKMQAMGQPGRGCRYIKKRVERQTHVSTVLLWYQNTGLPRKPGFECRPTCYPAQRSTRIHAFLSMETMFWDRYTCWNRGLVNFTQLPSACDLHAWSSFLPGPDAGWSKHSLRRFLGDLWTNFLY